jgi:menaquinol-cytochrome c reductase iron-sulfur subunit
LRPRAAGPPFAGVQTTMAPAPTTEPSSVATPRRQALVLFITGATALIGGALGTLLGVFAIRPAASATSGRWIRAGSLLELTPGTPLPRVVSVARAGGWYRERVRQTVFLVREGNKVTALSPTCTHLGCQVRWDRETTRFLCPCHGGAYDALGRVLEGPPPRPLDRVDVRVDASTDSIMVRV